MPTAAAQSGPCPHAPAPPRRRPPRRAAARSPRRCASASATRRSASVNPGSTSGRSSRTRSSASAYAAFCCLGGRGGRAERMLQKGFGEEECGTFSLILGRRVPHTLPGGAAPRAAPRAAHHQPRRPPQQHPLGPCAQRVERGQAVLRLMVASKGHLQLRLNHPILQLRHHLHAGGRGGAKSRGAQRHGVRATGRPTFSLLTKHALRAAPANRLAQGPLCSSHARLASPQARAATTGIRCHCPLHAPSAAGWGSRPRALRKRAARQRSPAAGASRCARCRRRTRGQKRGSAPGGGGGQHQGQAGAGVGGWLVARHGQHQRCILASQSAWLTQPASGGVKSWQLKQACPHPSAHLWPAAPAATLSQTGAASRVGPPPLLLPRATAPQGVAAEPAARAPWRPPPGAAAGGGAPPAPLAPPRPERRGRRHVRGRGGGQGRAGPAPAGTDGVAGWLCCANSLPEGQRA